MLHEKLTQAEMLVNYRTMLHKANRCTKADLDKAIDELEGEDKGQGEQQAH